MRRRLAFAAGLLLAGCAAPGASLPAGATPETQAGRGLYLAKCTLCHGVIEPREHRRSDWPKLVDLYGRRARLTPDQASRLLAYLEESSH